MTIVAAMNCGDHFLMASDSEATDEEFRFQAVKLGHLVEIPLAWGVAGLSAHAQEMTSWLRDYDWNHANWMQLRSDAEQQIASLNGKWRRLVRKSGKKPDPKDITKAIIVGYTQGTGHILSLTDTGPGEFETDRRFVAIGSGGPHAHVAEYTIRILQKDKYVYGKNILGAIVEIAARTALYCNGPVQGRTITLKGVEAW